MGRCPRCGYALRFDGRKYTCDWCGYPRSQRSLTTTVQSIERNVKNKIQGLIEGFRNQRQVYVSYPIAARPCTLCGQSIPLSVSRCPSCGTLQPHAQTGPLVPTPAAETSGVDRRVFDYIAGHNGTISLSQASMDLSLPHDVLQSSIDRLKSSGALSQT